MKFFKKKVELTKNKAQSWESKIIRLYVDAVMDYEKTSLLDVLNEVKRQRHLEYERGFNRGLSAGRMENQPDHCIDCACKHFEKDAT